MFAFFAVLWCVLLLGACGLIVYGLYQARKLRKANDADKTIKIKETK